MCGEMEYQRTLDRKKMPLCVLGHFFMGSGVHTRAQQTLAIPGSIGPFHSSPQEQEQGPKALTCLELFISQKCYFCHLSYFSSLFLMLLLQFCYEYVIES